MPNGNKDKTIVKSKRQRLEKIKKDKDSPKSKKIEEDEDPSKSKKTEEDEDSSMSEVRPKRKLQEKSDSDEASVQSEKDKDSPKSDIIEKDKDSLQSGKKKQRIPEAVDEAEVALPDQLRRMFGTRNVIVAGETHGDPKTGPIEKTLDPRFKISVTYEGGTIKTLGGDVTPDPPAYRLLYYLEDFYELLHGRMSNHSKPAYRQYYDGQMGILYNLYVKEFDSYSQSAIERSLYYEGEALTITYDRLDKFKYILFDTLNLFDKSPDGVSVYKDKLIQDNARDLDELFDTLKTKSGNSSTGPVMRKLRSARMYQALQADLADGGKKIYKVGNNHIQDIRAKFGPTAWVIDEAQYKSVLSSLGAKK